MINLRALANFIKILELGSVSRAADNLHIAQPALSNQLASLEEELQVTLFDRSSQGVQPTAAGMTLYRHAQIILKHVDEASNQVKTGSLISGRVSIGVPGSILEYLTVPLLERLHEEHPAVRPNISAYPSTYLGELVMNGRIEIALDYYSPSIKYLKAKLIAVEDLYFVLNAKNAKSLNARPHISLKEIAAYPLVLPGHPYTGRKLIEEAAARAGANLNVIAEVNTAGALREAAAAGIGGTILAWSGYAHYPKRSRLAIFAITPTIQRRIWLFMSDLLPLTATAKATARLIPSVFAGIATVNNWRGFTVQRP